MRSRFGHSSKLLSSGAHLAPKIPLPWPAVIASASKSLLHANLVPSGERRRGWELRRRLNSGSSTGLPPEHKSTAAGSTSTKINLVLAGSRTKPPGQHVRSVQWPEGRRSLPTCTWTSLDHKVRFCRSCRGTLTASGSRSSSANAVSSPRDEDDNPHSDRGHFPHAKNTRPASFYATRDSNLQRPLSPSPCRRGHAVQRRRIRPRLGS